MNFNYGSTDPYLLLLFLLLFIIVFNILVGVLVANAARRKNRSWSSFFWLTMIFGWPITSLVVATIPFNDYDPKNPMNANIPIKDFSTVANPAPRDD